MSLDLRYKSEQLNSRLWTWKILIAVLHVVVLKKAQLSRDFNPQTFVDLKKFLPTELRACLISADDFQCRGPRRRYFGRLYERRALKSAGNRQSSDDKLP